MNDKYGRINDFLYFFRDIAKENPDYYLHFKSVYEKLTRFGIDKKALINQNFKTWEDHFKHNRFCNVFVSPTWTYFCQFKSTDLAASMANEHLKIYISLDLEHIEQGAIQIFEFLSKERISHLSKIGSHVRIDDIVIRLINPQDVDKLTKFVSNNSYLQEGLIKANPFAFNYQGIAMAVDGSLSFNSVVAMMVKLYINDCKEKNILDKVDASNFINFVKNYYAKSFSSLKGLNDFSNDFDELERESFTPELFVNYRNVLELLIKSMNKDFSYNDYISHYQECRDKSQQLMKIKQIISIMHGNSNKSTKDGYSVIEKKVILDIQKILMVMGDKYGQNVAIESIINYTSTGDRTYLTRTNGLRDYIVNSSFRDDLLNILNKHNIDIRNYINIVSSIVVKTDEIYFEQAIMETYNKYERKYQEGLSRSNGMDFVVGATTQLIEFGKYNGFTRDNNARKNLEDHVSVQKVKEIIMQKLNLNDEKMLLSRNIDAIVEQYIKNVMNINSSKRMSNK